MLLPAPINLQVVPVSRDPNRANLDQRDERVGRRYSL
jgi:hypothetical protein